MNAKPRRNIGGSILGSTPSDLRAGIHMVRPLPDEDTHALVNAEGVELARHPNGWSCQALGERIAKGDADRAREQAVYIIRCGGSITEEGWRAVDAAPRIAQALRDAEAAAQAAARAAVAVEWQRKAAKRARWDAWWNGYGDGYTPVQAHERAAIMHQESAARAYRMARAAAGVVDDAV